MQNHGYPILTVPAVNKVANFSTSCQHLLPSFDYSHSTGFVVVSHCGFNLHFPKGWWASFHELINQLYVFSGEIHNQVFCPFFNYIVLLLLSYEFFLFSSLTIPFWSGMILILSVTELCIMVQHLILVNVPCVFEKICHLSLLGTAFSRGQWSKIVW